MSERRIYAESKTLCIICGLMAVVILLLASTMMAGCNISTTETGERENRDVETTEQQEAEEVINTQEETSSISEEAIRQWQDLAIRTAQSQTPAADLAKASELHVETPLYSFDLPESWYDRVDIAVDGDKVSVTSIDPFIENEILSASVHNGDTPDSAGDYVSSLVTYYPLSDGRHVEFWTFRAQSLAHGRSLDEDYATFPNDELDALIQLETGGILNLEIASNTNEALGVTDAFITGFLDKTFTAF